MITETHLPHNQLVVAGDYDPTPIHVGDAGGDDAVIPVDNRPRGRVCGYQDTGASPLSYLVLKEDGGLEWYVSDQLHPVEEDPAA